MLLNPGRTGGALEFHHALRRAGCDARCVVAEASTFIFASRSNGPAEAKIFRVKNAIPVAALPATDTPVAMAALNRAFPQFVPAQNVLHTSLDNMGAIFHPALTILNAGRIESTRGNYQFYVEGLTPSIARVLESLDRERVTVAAALGVRATPALEWLRAAYNATGSSLYEAMLNNPGYHGITAPANLEHRYIFEDVPMSLVPIAELGHAFGVATPAIDTMVRLASIIHGVNYRARGRTLERLGLAGMTLDEVQRYVETGDGIATPGSASPESDHPSRPQRPRLPPGSPPCRLTRRAVRRALPGGAAGRPGRPCWWTSAAPSPSCSWSTRRRGRSWPGPTTPPPWAKAWRWACGRGWPTSPWTPAPAAPSSSAGPAPASPAAAPPGGCAWWPWASSAS